MARIINNGEDVAINDVTRTSRITGTQRRAVVDPVGPVVYPNATLRWSAAVASVVVGVALSAMLVIIGVATGLIAGSNDSGADANGVLAAMGAWTVISVLVGSFAGSFVGGRLTGWMDRLSIAGHTLVSWGIATLVSLLLLCAVSIAFASTATSVATTATAAEVVSDGTAADTTGDGATAAGNQTANSAENTQSTQSTKDATSSGDAASNTGEALGGAGWALAVGMLLSLVASAMGWYLGARRRLTDIEREDTTVRVAD